MKVRILCMGNPLMGDDAAGLKVGEELKKLDLPEWVEIVECGTPGLALLDLVRGVGKVIIVDAASSGVKPGDAVRVRLGDAEFSGAHPRSVHGIGVAEVIRLAEALGESPSDVVIVCIGVKSVEPRLGLSLEAEKGVKKAINVVLEEIRATSPGLES